MNAVMQWAGYSIGAISSMQRTSAYKTKSVLAWGSAFIAAGGTYRSASLSGHHWQTVIASGSEIAPMMKLVELHDEVVG